MAGRYTLLDSAPDGDSIHFVPDDDADLVRDAPAIKRHPNGGITLRLDGVDALETHYLASGGLGVLRQPAPWPDRAALSLLTFLGFDEVRRHSDERIIASQPLATRGAIAVRRIDKYGRAVAFAFRGQFRASRTGHFELTPEVVRSSVNWHQLRHGHAYPIFYQDMSPALMALCSEASRAAQAERLGFWPEDRTHGGFALTSLDALKREALLLPKLFRRLVDHVGGNSGQLSLTTFRAFLEARIGQVSLWRESCSVSFADLVAIDGAALRLLVPPEDIAFAED
jgi:endonuclease YncB( thermonuclease family)